LDEDGDAVCPLTIDAARLFPAGRDEAAERAAATK
jgi:hypothetical protein